MKASTLFHTEHPWPMPDSADPLQGWTLTEVLQPSYGAKHDLYGQLYVHVKRELETFCKRLHTLNLNVSLFKKDAMDLPDTLATLRDKETFYDRIEVRYPLSYYQLIINSRLTFPSLPTSPTSDT